MKNIHLPALILISISGLFTETINAQSETFKLSDYKNPDYLYQTLNLNFKFNNSLYFSKDKFLPDVNSNNQFNLSSDANVSFSRYLNSRKRQGDTYLFFNTGIGSSRVNNSNDISNQEVKANNFSYSEHLSITTQQRFYNSKKYYFEADASLYSGLDGNKQIYKSMNTDTINSSFDRKTKDFSNSFSGAFYLGKGRIEQVQDAQLAMYLIEDLQKLNRQKRISTDEDVLELAKLITKLKYKRFFDYRLRHIAEITAVDSFLQTNGIAGKADAMYFTSLNDNWAYANNPVRQSGYRIFSGVEAGFSFDNNYYFHDDKLKLPGDETLETTQKQTAMDLFLVAGYSYEKPVNLKWQKSANIKAGIGISQDKDSRRDQQATTDFTLKSYTELFPMLRLSANYGFGYYPNTRTWLTFNLLLIADGYKEMKGETKETKTDFKNTLDVSTGPEVDAYYYLSERLRLNLNFSSRFYLINQKFIYENANETSGKTTSTFWNQNFSASLTYSLF